MPYKKKHKSSKANATTEPSTENTAEGSTTAPNAFSDKPIFFHKLDTEHGYLCQWYPSHFVCSQGLEWNCCEQYMMYHKAATFEDEETMAAVRRSNNPRDQKALGKAVKGFEAEVWDRVKFDVVVQANMLKFSQSTVDGNDCFVYANCAPEDPSGKVYLRQMLLATGDRELAEASVFDRVWGIGFSAKFASKAPRVQWGENLLGKALMEVRRRLREEGAEDSESTSIVDAG